MKIALMVKRLEMKSDGTTKGKGDAVVNIAHSNTGMIFGWGDGDSFEVSYDDFALLTEVVRTVYSKIEKEKYMAQMIAPSKLEN